MTARPAPAPRALFVTNGHGEAAIAARIAEELRCLGPVATDHFPLVGAGFAVAGFPEVGPRRRMPSGGLVAMGNLRAFAADLGAGWLGLFGAQLGFVRGARRHYAAIVAIGDAYACAVAGLARLPLLFVGTAKSVAVAPYGALERRFLGGADRVFVRDPATAEGLRRHGVLAEAPGNVIVDLLLPGERYTWPAPLGIALLPGSRGRAYDDAERLAAIAAAAAARIPGVAVALSIAPTLDPDRFASVLRRHPQLAAWHGSVGGVLDGASVALGQAGTANEAAAANGVPVMALERAGDRRGGWYRMRQERLLAGAMVVVPDDVAVAADALVALLADPERRRAMGETGRVRLGPPGGAATIARAVAAAVGLAAPAGT